MADLIGREVLSEIGKITQAYQATHDGAGNRLPYLSRSFISFTFGGKAIEDFNLIATINGDRIENSLYSSFQDSTSTYDTLDGQLYWGSHFDAKELSFNLSTDGISENQLDDFRELFKPGNIQELILSEHPNRAIMARVKEAPNISLLPFEEQISFSLNGVEVSTSTAVYKGDITLNLIMDDPYWYSKLTYMPTYINKVTLEELDINSQNENKVNAETDKDMLKIMYEDRIPYQNMINGNMFLGGNVLVTQENRVGSARVNQAFLGVITGESAGLTVNSSTPQYLFYGGTAKCFPKIKFTLTPTFDENNGYINCPKNNYTSGSNYSYIQIGNSKMEFTTPSMLTGYNQAINLINNSTNMSKIELLDKIKLEVNEYWARAWAAACVNAVENTTIIDLDINTMKNNMKLFIQDSSGNNQSITFTIDSKTGEAIGRFSIRTVYGSSTLTTIEENVGDMLRSKYLVIEGRDSLDFSQEMSTSNCKTITSNEQLENVLIFFKNMYL